MLLHKNHTHNGKILTPAGRYPLGDLRYWSELLPIYATVIENSNTVVVLEVSVIERIESKGDI